MAEKKAVKIKEKAAVKKTAASGKYLVIVESPTKEKTIGKMLGSAYTVRSSYGHVRDLPGKVMGVDENKNFKPSYEVLPRAKKNLPDLKKIAKAADCVYLATDHDREGESIAWHLVEMLDLDNSKVKRITFHEITKQAINSALENPREVDMRLVNAQQARRILDRLVGYELSPFLWRRVRYGLSAGRVQSVAARLIVEREREIQKFNKEEYWSIEGDFSKKNDKKIFRGRLISVDGNSLDKMAVKSGAEAEKLIARLKEADYRIKEVSSKSFEELINSSVIQLYCGNLNAEQTSFSNISRGTGIIISSNGNVLTNRHIVYDENTQKIKNNCFILRSPFPNAESQKPKIYYTAEVTDYPLIEKLSDSFSEDKYYNDFAVLKIVSKIGIESKINFLLGFDLAAPADYLVIENNNIFNFLPIDWNYQPKDGDHLITLGYGVDASHLANQITSTVGKLFGNISVDKSLKPQILLINSNATTGFSGGALVNPQSKGLVGLISWITNGDEAGKYTVAIFRDFLKTQML